MNFELRYFDFDISSYYPFTLKLQDECIRDFLLHQIYMHNYNEGQYINKINYIVWRLKL